MQSGGRMKNGLMAIVVMGLTTVGVLGALSRRCAAAGRGLRQGTNPIRPAAYADPLRRWQHSGRGLCAASFARPAVRRPRSVGADCLSPHGERREGNHRRVETARVPAGWWC